MTSPSEELELPLFGIRINEALFTEVEVNGGCDTVFLNGGSSCLPPSPHRQQTLATEEEDITLQLDR